MLRGCIYLSKKLEQSLNKIDKLFDKMKYNNVSTNEKRNVSYRTYKNYGDQMKAIMRQAYKDFGIERIEDLTIDMFKEMINERIEQYHNGKFSESNNINSKISAIRAFSIGFEKTNVFRKTKNDAAVAEFNENAIKEMRIHLRESEVVRRGSDSTVLRANKKQALRVINNIQKDGYDKENRSKAADVSLFTLITGARISSSLKIRVEDIKFDEKRVLMKSAKGGLDYSVQMTSDNINVLKRLVEGLSPNQRLFEFKRKDGSYMSNEEARKMITRYVEQSGRAFEDITEKIHKEPNGTEKKVKVKSTFTHHSLRKAFAHQTMVQYIKEIKTNDDIKKELEKLIKADPKVKEKFERLVRRENAYRIARGKALKEISLGAAITFFTSVQLGHYRNDIVSSHYCNYKEALLTVQKT